MRVKSSSNWSMKSSQLGGVWRTCQRCIDHYRHRPGIGAELRGYGAVPPPLGLQLRLTGNRQGQEGIMVDSPLPLSSGVQQTHRHA